MKARIGSGFLILILGLSVVSGTAIALKREEASVLREELKMMRSQARELSSVRAENQRLREQQIPAEALERLRADHAALVRLRSELEDLRKR